MMDFSTVTNDVVIFNIIENIYGTDSVASVIKWSDLPDGSIQPGRVLYLRKTGDFQDIDVICFDNILDQGWHMVCDQCYIHIQPCDRNPENSQYYDQR